MAADILVVDDEQDIRELVAGILEDEGHVASMAFDADSALEAISKRVPQMVFLDIWLQGSRLDGLQLLEEIKKLHPNIPVVMISGHGNIETAVASIKRGAYDFIEKPFKADRLLLLAQRALETVSLRQEVSTLKEKATDDREMIGRSAAMQTLRQNVARIAPTNSRVMIIGPSGSGKEMVARSIHDQSQRKEGPFVTINAASMTPDRFEAALFGTEDGTEARHVGALERAHRGTLYLDEVADMPVETQGRILRVLTEQKFERVGGSSRVTVDVRIVSSTSQNIESLIERGRFRSDLFHRLSVVPLSVPPLQERREDVPMLIDHFMREIARQQGIRTRPIGNDAMAVLQSHDWPGNVRQLRNNIERLMILSQADGEASSVITAEMLPSEIGEMMPRLGSGDSDEHMISLPLREAREAFEKSYLIAQINRFGGNISRTAEFIGMERSALHRKLKSLGV